MSSPFQTYHKPNSPPTWPPIPTRNLLPINPPPVNLLPTPLPPCPSPERAPFPQMLRRHPNTIPYALTTHIVPAAHFRTSAHVPVPALLTSESFSIPRAPSALTVDHSSITRGRASKEVDPKSNSGNSKQAVLKATHTHLRALRTTTTPQAASSPRVLWNCVGRYSRDVDENKSAKDSILNITGGEIQRRNLKERSEHTRVTLLFAHAAGFPKEIWEPTIRYLLSDESITGEIGEVVDEVWTWEGVQHGDACLLNEGALSGLFDWADGARDILNFLLHFMPDDPFSLPSSSTKTPLPTHLPRVSQSESDRRRTYGFRHRKLIVVGHSYGGCTSAHAALTYPALFSALILVDPVIIKPTTDPNSKEEQVSAQLALGTMGKRDEWSSREEAFRFLSTSPTLNLWHEDVLWAYIDGGTCPVSSSSATDTSTAIRLKMPGIYEAIIFSETHTQHEVFQCMPDLDERVELLWVVPGEDGPRDFCAPGSTEERVWIRPKNSTNVRVTGAGHFIPQEAPRSLADVIREFILKRYTTQKFELKANL